MSGWKIATRALHAVGGGPKAADDFLIQQDGSLPAWQLYAAGQRGLMSCKGIGLKARWSLTKKGWAFVENRLVMLSIVRKHVPGISGRAPGTVQRLHATWLAPLGSAFSSGQRVIVMPNELEKPAHNFVDMRANNCHNIGS